MCRKVKAGALSLVLTISLVVAAILGSLVMLYYYNKLSFIQTETRQKLKSNARSGLQYLLATQGSGYESPTDVDLLGEDTDSVVLSRTLWGVYDVLVAQARQGRHVETMAALVGVYPQRDFNLAFYLCEEERPLALSGRALLKGSFRLPKAGVKAAYVDGTGFMGAKLVDGEVKESTAELPKLDADFLKRVKENARVGFPAIPLQPLQQDVGSGLKFPFTGEGALIKASRSLHLANTALSGKVILASDKEVIISRTARLEDVLVAAPVIRVEEGFSGSVQLFATDSVILEKGSHLNYPSAICLYSKQEGARIRLEEGSYIAGLIYLGGDRERLKDIISIRKGATVIGHVYADSFVQHEGTIRGGLYCRRLLHKTNTSLYENYLVDASVDGTALPAAFLMAPMAGAGSGWGIAKWLR